MPSLYPSRRLPNHHPSDRKNFAIRTLADDPRLLIELFGQIDELAAFAVLRAAGRDGDAG